MTHVDPVIATKPRNTKNKKNKIVLFREFVPSWRYTGVR